MYVSQIIKENIGNEVCKHIYYKNKIISAKLLNSNYDALVYIYLRVFTISYIIFNSKHDC